MENRQMTLSNPKLELKKVGQTYIMTPKDGNIRQTLIFLHGSAESGSKWAKYFMDGDAVPDGTKIICPTAPRRFIEFWSREGNTWYDYINRPETNIQEISMTMNVEHAEDSCEIIKKLLEQEIAEMKDSTKVFLGGFSQGGMIAARVWKRFNKPLAGLVIYNMGSDSTIKPDPAQKLSPVFWTHGLEDAIVKYEFGLEDNKMLNDGVRKFVHFKRDDLGHDADDKTRAETKKFMTESLIRPKL